MLSRTKNINNTLDLLTDSQRVLSFMQQCLTRNSWPELNQESQEGFDIIIEDVKEKLEKAQKAIKAETK